MKYYTKEEFIEKSKVSCSTIDRFYRKYPEIGNERKEVGKRKDIPESHLRYFDLGLMIKSDQEKDKKIKNLQNMLRVVKDENSLATNFWYMDWKFFGTVSYSSDCTRDTCYNKMVKMFNHLKLNVVDTELSLFVKTESFPVRSVTHIDCVLNCSVSNLDQVRNLITEMFPRDRVDLQTYNLDEAGIFYISKDGYDGIAWDYLK